MRFLVYVSISFSLSLPLAHAAPDSDAPGSDKVSIEFIQPEKFTDARYENRYRSHTRVTRDLAEYIYTLGDDYLPEGYHLAIQVLDIDLAGRYEPWRMHGADVRYIRDITWPRINLTFALRDSNGELVSQGEESVVDMNYLNGIQHHRQSDRLRYEKAMLDDWFHDHFKNLEPQQGKQ